MQRILFVDDEPKLLSGLRRMLHGMRTEWDMEFAGSGAEALTRLFDQPCDVVVTDMRMPFMDGSELLRLVREQFPATVRMVLSGQCDRHAVLKAVGPAHQFLTKPCNSEKLKEVLGRACRLRDRMPAPKAKKLVSRIASIPSLPESVAALKAELDRPAASVRQVGRIVAADPGMTARVLQTVNSGFFGSPQRTVDPGRAADLLGQERLRDLAGCSEAFSAPAHSEPLAARLAAVIEHSRAVAEAAGRIAEAESDDPEMIADARCGGLLHDVGTFVLMQHESEQTPDLLARSADHDELCRNERRTFGADHATMGAYLLALWGLPQSLVDIAAMHHAPGRSDDCAFTALTAVHAADALCHDLSSDSFVQERLLDYPYLARIGKADRVFVWAELCRTAQPEGVLV